MQDTDPNDAALTSWLRLAHTPGLGLAGARRLLEHCGSVHAVFGGAARGAEVDGAVLARLQAPPDAAMRDLLARTLAWCRLPGHYLLTLDHPDYPPALRLIDDPPLLLYAAGRIELLARPALAVVGSRNASCQGRENARQFAAAASAVGVTVVSGLALGIDAAAHVGALAHAGATVAVIGTGIDIVYPQKNEALARRIAADGCVLSEFALGMPPSPHNFPRRNRLISGLASAVLVVEAAARSGSLITARLALEQGREVLAIPGSIHATLSKGCNSLIRDGATMVESAQDVLRPFARSPLPAALAPKVCRDPLLALIGDDPVDLDTLAARSASGVAELAARLLALELSGQLERLPGARFQRVRQ